MKPIKILLYAVAVIACLLLTSCDTYTYGQLGGADQTETLYPGDPEFESIMSNMCGVWYSHYAGIGRLDGYRIGKMADYYELAVESRKEAIFDRLSPNMTKDGYLETAGIPKETFTAGSDSYFLLYDDTVYGEGEDGTGGNGGWDFFIMRYIGIVRAVNVFNGNKDRGAVIIEYFTGGCPTWDIDIAYGQRPFFGIYYRALSSNIVQMANAVDLAALYAGKNYYTETATLDEAVTLNSVENEAEFISWGVVIPQDREPR
jgi:hypothetical protein